MKNKIVYTSVFYKRLKVFRKKHRSIFDDLEKLEKQLLETPEMGTSLGNGLYKIRLAVESKGKGKSGGYRVITYLIENKNSQTTINMLIIYDKSEESNIDKQSLLDLIKVLF